MPYIFGDGFDLYATTADAILGYWDSGVTTSAAITTGRFTGSQALSVAGTTFSLVKSSASNDAMHHIVCAIRQTAVLSGTTLGTYIQLSDGATNQCCIVFRSDGAILLTSATPVGTVLATYTGAVSAQNTWFAFEFEVVINNTTGSFAARKNGAASNDFSATSLNTRPGANNYANKLTVSMNAAVSAQQLDDFLWRSDTSGVAWAGDIRCYTRMPASDASVQFSRSPITNIQTPAALLTTNAIAAGTARYTPFTAAYDGTIGSATVQFGTGYTGNLKCSLFASSGSAPTTVLGSATVVTNPVAGSNALTFGTPVTVAKGVQYWIGFDSDTSSGTWNVSAGTAGVSSTTPYASFPVASPSTAAAAQIICTLTITLTTNYQVVSEAQQDGTTSYVFDSTAGHADFYNIAAIAGTPVATVAVTTRGFIEKSDVGARTAAVQLKSAGTTVASVTASPSSSWGWMWRTDITDPGTSAPWTAIGVNNVTIGPTTVA